MTFEDVLQWVGDTGCFQVLIVFLALLTHVLTSTYEFMENFTAGIPEHHCSVHLLDYPNPEANMTLNLTVEALLRVSIPMGPNQKPEQCRRFQQIQWQLLDPNASASNYSELETEPCLDGWTYSQSVFTSTIVSEWDLVCDYKSLKYMAQSITLTGYLLGITITGLTSDRFGRKPLVICSCLASGVLNICCAFAPTFSIYCILKFLCSASVSVVQTNFIIIVLELTSVNWKPLVIMVQTLAGCIGSILLGGLAYTLRDWRMLQWAVGGPFIVVFLVICCCLTESIRWLMVTGKTQQAAKELKKIAYINGKKDVVQNLTTEALISKMGEMTVPRKHFKVKQIIVNPAIFRILLCGSTLWFSLIFSSYGHYLDIQNLGDDIFTSQFILGAVNLLSMLPVFFILRHVHRRPSLFPFTLLFGSSHIVTIFVPKEMHIPRLAVFVIGRTFAAVSFGILVAFLHELLPTIFRSTMQSIFNVCVRLGGTLSALALITRQYFIHLPWILYAAVPIAGSFCIFFLPETFNLPLVDTIKDVENRFKSKSTREKQRQDLLRTSEC